MKITVNIQSKKSVGENVHVIVLTGGPCSGKTTALEMIKERLENMKYKVLVCTESATKLMVGGADGKDIGADIFQKQIFLDSLMQEERFIDLACAYRDLGKKVIVICDRGLMDGKAYSSSDEFFNKMVESVGLTIKDICHDRYHAVMHMHSVAFGAEDFYTLQNNKVRIETTIEDARDADNRTYNAWKDHPHIRLIDNSTDFNGKVNKLFDEICLVLNC